MIYFDNSATGYFKPRAVSEAVINTVKYLSANPQRSAHRLAITGAKIVSDTRQLLSETFDGVENRVIFTKNCTEAINTALFGFIKKGDHIITTIYEHNSVLRPLFELKRRLDISLDIVSPKDGKDIVSAIQDKINDKTALIVTTAISNVTGEVLPIKKIGELAKRYNVKFMVDGAQGGGHIPLYLKKQNIDILCLAGHKGLYGIMGSGVLLFNENVEIAPLTFGGTGTESFNVYQPSQYPERLEAGTLNLPAIASLYEGVKYVKDNIESFGERLKNLSKEIIDRLNLMPKVRCYSSPNEAGIVSFRINEKESSAVADTLNYEYDIAVRSGLHCAPLIHRYLNTEDGGLIRVSLAVQNTSHEIAYFIKAISEICKH